MKLTHYSRALVAMMFLSPFAMLHAVDFEKDIQPILKDHCFKCHSGPRAKAKIRYDNVRYFKEVIGTDQYAIVVPGKPDQSKLLKLASLPQTATDAMPPPKAKDEPMSARDLAMVRQWILEGASLEPRPSAAEAAPTPTTETAADPNKIHTWTNSKGKSLPATFVSLSGTAVKLRKEDGTEFDYPLNLLSEASQKLAAELAK